MLLYIGVRVLLAIGGKQQERYKIKLMYVSKAACKLTQAIIFYSFSSLRKIFSEPSGNKICFLPSG